MKKRILSSLIAAVMAVSCTAAVMAEDKTPTVYVDSSEIFFEDQAPVILGEGTTLVPARGVFEAMGATVTWDSEKRLVEVKSADNNTIVKLTIDDSTMKVYDMSGMFASLMMGQDFNAPETPVTLAVAPQIINDRTMIPLRAISEALTADVQWDGVQYKIDITTDDAPASVDTLPAYTMTASAPQVAAGETVDLYIAAKNIPADTYVSGVTATIEYNKENFEFVESVLVNGETVIEGTTSASNPDFGWGALKSVHITIDKETSVTTDGTIMKVTFKSLNGGEGKFALSNGYHSRLGFNTSLLVDTIDLKTTLFEGNDLFIDTTEVVVNGAEAVVDTTTEETDVTEDAADTTTEETDATEDVADTTTEETDDTTVTE